MCGSRAAEMPTLNVSIYENGFQSADGRPKNINEGTEQLTNAVWEVGIGMSERDFSRETAQMDATETSARVEFEAWLKRWKDAGQEQQVEFDDWLRRKAQWEKDKKNRWRDFLRGLSRTISVERHELLPILKWGAVAVVFVVQGCMMREGHSKQTLFLMNVMQDSRAELKKVTHRLDSIVSDTLDARTAAERHPDIQDQAKQALKILEDVDWELDIESRTQP